MYSGIRLQTARDSGTNGYVQQNNSKSSNNDVVSIGIGGVKKANKEILEHDRKSQIELKVFMLEDKLIQQSFDDDEVQGMLLDARKRFEKEMEEKERGNAFVAVKIYIYLVE